MPTIEENFRVWNFEHGWNDQAEEWSTNFPGGSKTIWYGLIYPRIHHFLPTGTILEIAPGMGRWTQYLKDSCRRLIIVDLSDKCIDSCKKRFSDISHIEYHVTDGKSLQMIEDNSIDFAFSFDSLVHCEADVLESYLTQLAAKLKSEGVGFFHHSNLKNYSRFLKYFDERLTRHIGYKSSWRGQSVNADVFNKLCAKTGLFCFSQELVNWDSSGLFLVDAFSMFCRKEFSKGSQNMIIKNRNYMNANIFAMKLARAALRRGKA